MIQIKLKCLLLEFFPLLYNYILYLWNIWHLQNYLVLICQLYVENLSFSCHSRWLKKNPQISWYVWQSISPWKFLPQLKSIRSALGSVYLERFKSSRILCIFYKVSICCMALDFFPFFIPKMLKCIESVFFRINIYFFQISTVCWSCFLRHFIYDKSIFLHSKITSLQ